MSLTEAPGSEPQPESQASTGTEDTVPRPTPPATRSDRGAASDRNRKRASPAPKSLRPDTAPQNGFDLIERLTVWLTGNTEVTIRAVVLLAAGLVAALLYVAGVMGAAHVLGVSPWFSVALTSALVGAPVVKGRFSARRDREIPTAGGDPEKGDGDAPPANR